MVGNIAVQKSLIDPIDNLLEISFPTKPTDKVDVEVFEKLYRYLFACLREQVNNTKYHFTQF